MFVAFIGNDNTDDWIVSVCVEIVVQLKASIKRSTGSNIKSICIRPWPEKAKNAKTTMIINTNYIISNKKPVNLVGPGETPRHSIWKYLQAFTEWWFCVMPWPARIIRLFADPLDSLYELLCSIQSHFAVDWRPIVTSYPACLWDSPSLIRLWNLMILR